MVSRKCNLVPGSLEVCTKFFPAVKKKAGQGGEKERGQYELWNRGVKPRQGRGKWVEGRKYARTEGGKQHQQCSRLPREHTSAVQGMCCCSFQGDGATFQKVHQVSKGLLRNLPREEREVTHKWGGL